MAVYHGARPRSTFPAIGGGRPRTTDAAAAPSRRRLRAAGAVRARRRSDRSPLVIGGVVLAFLLAFFSLAQTVAVSATSYDLDRLGTERSRLESRQRDVASDLNRLGSEPAVRKQAIDLGLGQLAEPLVVPAR